MSLQRTDPHPVSSVYICEAPGCGKEVNDIDVVSYGVVLRLPGKNGVIPAFQCSAEQHFGCCEEHAWQALQACHEEHIKPVHTQRHAEVEADPDRMGTVETLRATHAQRAAWVRR